MNEIFTPVNNACQNNGPANLIDDLITDDKDQQFYAFVKEELKKMTVEPDPAVTKRILEFSRSVRPR